MIFDRKCWRTNCSDSFRCVARSFHLSGKRCNRCILYYRCSPSFFRWEVDGTFKISFIEITIDIVIRRLWLFAIWLWFSLPASTVCTPDERKHENKFELVLGQKYPIWAKPGEKVFSYKYLSGKTKTLTQGCNEIWKSLISLIKIPSK